MKKLFFALAFSIIGVAAPAQNISGTWQGDLVAGLQKLKLKLHLTDDGQCTLDSPNQGAYGIRGTIDFISADSLSIHVGGGITYSARLADGELKGTFAQSGFKFPLNLQPGDDKPVVRPQTPVPPYPYTTEEVTFVNAEGGTTLAGTLTVPDGARCVVLMVTGSGPQNRDEELFLHKPFAVLADRLARAGIATLRYDDRGVGQTVGGRANDNTQELSGDALAGIEWLRQSGRFKKVGILGHSEGGLIAFMLGGQHKVDFIVSLAGSAVRGDSVLLTQSKALGGDAAKDLTIEQLREMPDLKNDNWVRWFLDYDPQPAIAQIQCPVMALNGSKDLQVLASQNLPALRRTLPADKRHLIKQYDGLNHLFQHSDTGQPSEYGDIEETFSDEAISDIAAWLQQFNK